MQLASPSQLCSALGIVPEHAYWVMEAKESQATAAGRSTHISTHPSPHPPAFPSSLLLANRRPTTLRWQWAIADLQVEPGLRLVRVRNSTMPFGWTVSERV